MLYSAVTFFCIALVSGVFGVTGADNTGLDIARSAFVIFTALFVACLILGVELPGFMRSLLRRRGLNGM